MAEAKSLRASSNTPAMKGTTGCPTCSRLRDISSARRTRTNRAGSRVTRLLLSRLRVQQAAEGRLILLIGQGLPPLVWRQVAGHAATRFGDQIVATPEPQASGVARGRRYDVLTVWTEPCVIDRAVLDDARELLPCLQIPDARGVVSTAGEQIREVRTEIDSRAPPPAE